MKITVFGTGYVGLVTGTCLASVGNDVLCVDIDAQKIALLQQGQLPIYEPGLESLLNENIGNGTLKFSSDLAQGVEHGLFLFIAVGTPQDEDGSADLQHVLSVAETIGKHIDNYKIVVNKSTVPVGTADKVRNTILKNCAGSPEFDVVSNPEFLKEGAAVDDYMRPDRIIIGTDNPRTTELLRALYAPFNRSHDRIIAMDIRSAELTKYAANAMLATKISFMNEMANLAEKLGADIENVRIGIGADPRIGYHFIYPGCGYGGSCFPKDIKALQSISREVGGEPLLMDAVDRINTGQKEVLFHKIMQHFDGDCSGHTFAVWGLSFKPNTDDMREAPSRRLIELLRQNGATVQAYDPVANDEAKKIFGDDQQINICESPETALDKADALIIVTEWNVFRSPDFTRIKKSLKAPVIFDGRNLYDPKHMKNEGFSYYAIGRSPAK